jgi:hypothetical protein
MIRRGALIAGVVAAVALVGGCVGPPADPSPEAGAAQLLSYIGLPPGTQPEARPIEETLLDNDPSIAWIDDDRFAVVTHGSSSCAPVLDVQLEDDTLVVGVIPRVHEPTSVGALTGLCTADNATVTHILPLPIADVDRIEVVLDLAPEHGGSALLTLVRGPDQTRLPDPDESFMFFGSSSFGLPAGYVDPAASGEVTGPAINDPDAIRMDDGSLAIILWGGSTCVPQPTRYRLDDDGVIEILLRTPGFPNEPPCQDDRVAITAVPDARILPNGFDASEPFTVKFITPDGTPVIRTVT